MRNLTDVAFQMEGDIMGAVEAVAAQSVARIRQSLSSHGRSSPGQPPASRSGTLANSIHSVTSGEDVVIYSDDPVAAFMEMGTAYILPRPFMGPEMLRLQQTLLKDVGGMLKSKWGLR